MKTKKLIVFLFVEAMMFLTGCGGDKTQMLQQLKIVQW